MAELRRRAVAVAAVERAIAEYVAAGGGVPVLALCPGCVERLRRGRKVRDAEGKAA